MKKTKRAISIAAALMMLAVSLTGCGNGKSNVSSDGVKEHSAFIFMSPTAYDKDMPVWKTAEEKTGIRLINTVSQISSDANTAYNTMLAASDLPDVVLTGTTNMRELAKSGGLVPLDDLIDKYAPNIKSFFENCPEGKAMATIGDKIYFIPGTLVDVGSATAPSQGFFIRQDWLDKLGLDTPTTIQEYHDVLKAFKTQDPNGNGQADEIPYFSRTKSLEGLLQLWNASPYSLKDEDGNVVYSPLTENYKEAMKELSKWYAEGLIDPEIFSRTQARDQLLGQNVGGSTVDWFSSTGAYNTSLKDVIPGFEFDYMLPPENSDGEVRSLVARGKLHGYGWGISTAVDEEDYIELIKYFDFWMSKEGSDLSSHGVEGVSYTNNPDGSFDWTDEAKNYADGIPNYLRSIGVTELGSIGQIEVEESQMAENAREGFIAYKELVEEPVKNLSYDDEDQKIVTKYETNIRTAINEYTAKWLMGQMDVDATWDEYISTLKSMGVDELVKAYNNAYKHMYGDK